MRNTLSSLCLFALFVHNAWAETPSADIYDCRDLKSEAERLRCYDTLPLDTETQPPPAEDESAADARPALEQRMQKERDLARRAFAILPHRPNYLLQTYSSTPNVAPFSTIDPDADLQHQEVKYQISLRVPLWNKMFGDNGDLWFAYSQLSFWQAYNIKRSAPFRETDYEPELGLTFHTDFSLLGLRHRLFSLGFAHQSNGRDDLLSRSWNRLWASFELERGNFVLALKPWYRLPEESATDYNPDIEDYAGRVQLRLTYKYREQVFSTTLRNNLRSSDNRSGYELGWSFPYSKRIKGLVQFYNGYGESLIDYNVRTRRFGIGLLVEDWL